MKRKSAWQYLIARRKAFGDDYRLGDDSPFYPLKLMAKRVGVSVQTLRNWRTRYRGDTARSHTKIRRVGRPRLFDRVDKSRIEKLLADPAVKWGFRGSWSLGKLVLCLRKHYPDTRCSRTQLHRELEKRDGKWRVKARR